MGFQWVKQLSVDDAADKTDDSEATERLLQQARLFISKDRSHIQLFSVVVAPVFSIALLYIVSLDDNSFANKTACSNGHDGKLHFADQIDGWTAHSW